MGGERYTVNGTKSVLHYTPVTDQVNLIKYFMCFAFVLLSCISVGGVWGARCRKGSGKCQHILCASGDYMWHKI